MPQWFRIVVLANVLTMLLQSGFAGSMMSGNGNAVTLHELTGKVLVVLGTAQVALLLISARSQWKYPRWLLLSSIGMVAAEIIEFSLGHYGQVVIHVPFGLAIFGGMVRQLVWSFQPM